MGRLVRAAYGELGSRIRNGVMNDSVPITQQTRSAVRAGRTLQQQQEANLLRRRDALMEQHRRSDVLRRRDEVMARRRGR